MSNDRAQRYHEMLLREDVSIDAGPVAEKKANIKLTFDFENKMDSFGAYGSDGNPEALKEININMAAILWACTEDPDLAWKEFTADVILHELLHAIEEMVGKCFKEKDVEDSILAARGIDRESIPDYPNEDSAYDGAVRRAEIAESRVQELEALLLKSRQHA